MPDSAPASLKIKLLISVRYFVAIFLIFAFVDFLRLYFHIRYSLNDPGKVISFATYVLIIYTSIAMVTAFVCFCILLFFISDSKWLQINFRIIAGLSLLIPCLAAYNLNFPGYWTDAKSLFFSFVFMILSFAAAVLIARSFMNPINRVLEKISAKHILRLYAALLCGNILGCLITQAYIRLFPASGIQENANVILISIDTLSAQHMGTYGYSKNTSPNIDTIASQGVRFNHCYAQSHWTLPSHMSIMTGLYPAAHGIYKDATRLNESVMTLASALRLNHYRTMAFVDSPYAGHVGAHFGFDQGFDFYDHVMDNLAEWERLAIWKFFRKVILAVHPQWIYSMHSPKHADDITAKALTWMKSHKGKKSFFLFLHFFDVHSVAAKLPYVSPDPFQSMFFPHYPGSFSGCDDDNVCGSKYLTKMNQKLCKGEITGDFYSKEDKQYISSLYDGGIRHMDFILGEFFDKFQKLSHSSNSIVVITADHGEEFLQHCQFLHGQYYDEIIHVPLLFWYPKHIPAGLAIDEKVMTIDIMPTLLEMLNCETSGTTQGQSLCSLFGSDSEPLKREYLFCGDDHGRDTTAIVINGGYKYISNSHIRRNWAFNPGSYELYDLCRDPSEQMNLWDKGPLHRDFKNRVHLWRAECDSLHSAYYADDPGMTKKIDPETLKQLRALGYIK